MARADDDRIVDGGHREVGSQVLSARPALAVQSPASTSCAGDLEGEGVAARGAFRTEVGQSDRERRAVYAHLERGGDAEHRHRRAGGDFDVPQNERFAGPAGRDGVQAPGFFVKKTCLTARPLLGRWPTCSIRLYFTMNSPNFCSGRLPSVHWQHRPANRVP